MPGFQKQVILDERSAAFTALGIGKATNQPAALICTSGTAVANYFPAVIEARKSSVPLLVLSADRPPHLHDTGANQTIEQQRIFGDYPVLFRDAGEPVMHETALEEVEQFASEAVEIAIRQQGPVHLNFPFRKPLEPEQKFVTTITKENKKPDDLFAPASPKTRGPDHSFAAGNPKTSVEGFPPKDSVEATSRLREFRLDDKLQQHMQKADKPLVIIGQLAPGTETARIFQLAKALHAPVLSEQGFNTGDANGIEGFEGFLRDLKRAEELKPDIILRFGRQPASKSLLQAIEQWSPCRHMHVSDTEYQSDIAGTTTDHVSWNGNPFSTNRLYNSAEKSSPRGDSSKRIPLVLWKTTFVVPPHFAPARDKQTNDPIPTIRGKQAAESSRWLHRWKNQERDYFERSSRLFEAQQTLTDGHIYHHLAPAIPRNWFIFFSNSFPARDRSMFGRWSAPTVVSETAGIQPGGSQPNKRNSRKVYITPRVYTNRGASGIDGITSTAMGIGIGAHQPGILFTGDLAFLHDTNALLNKKVLQQPLVVIVINNRGGSIFRMLPIAEHKAHFNTYFETPQQAHIAALTKSYGIHTKTITTIKDLRQLDLQEVVSQSDSMLHIIECKTDADASMQLRHKLWGEG
jgi:2-succinyl-5-enolpyruvyl-6-hydroxy-3-cyclohexene-1-carboxylate synthase